MVIQFIVFLTLSTLICRSTDISKCFSESLGIRDNESTVVDLVISNSKELCEISRDIRTSTHRICSIEEKIIQTTTFNKYICYRTLEVRDILKMLWKRGEIAP